MGIFSKRKEKKWLFYIERLNDKISEELELEPWLQELIMSMIENEEQSRAREKMAAWIEGWEGAGKLPEDMEDEKLLLEVYNNHRDWTERTLQFHIEVRKADNETLKSLVEQIGEPVTSMSLEAQKAYIALWGEILNAVSQAIWDNRMGGSSF